MGEWFSSQITLGNLLTLAGLLVSAGWHARRVISVEQAVAVVSAEVHAVKETLDDEIGAIEVRREADLIAIAQQYQRKDVQEATLTSINLQLSDIRSTLRDMQHTK
jgi:hypothetical protein